MAPREDVSSDEVLSLPISVVPGLGHGDALEDGDPVRLEVVVDALEVGAEVLRAHSLQHFDRYHLIIP